MSNVEFSDANARATWGVIHCRLISSHNARINEVFFDAIKKQHKMTLAYALRNRSKSARPRLNH